MNQNYVIKAIATGVLAVTLAGCDNDTTKNAVDKAVGTVADKAKDLGGEAGTVIAKVQGLVAEKKYSEALSALGGLKDIKLSDQQQKVVDELKAQIQKLMGGATPAP